VTPSEHAPFLHAPLISVLMPVYNEVNTVKVMVTRVVELPLLLELIIVDDGSTDGTQAVLQEIEGAGDSRIKVVLAPFNVGKGSAIKIALTHATGDIVVIQDADCEYDPNDLIPMVEKIKEGAEVVFGTRLSAEAQRMNNDEKAARDRFYIARRLLPILTNLLYGTKITDEATCYKMFRREIAHFPLRCQRFDFCPEFTAKIAKRGYKIHEIPIHYSPRTLSQGKKINWRDAFEAVWALVKFRFVD
jgi:dolichol-phosphate mannosyltransferase